MGILDRPNFDSWRGMSLSAVHGRLEVGMDHESHDVVLYPGDRPAEVMSPAGVQRRTPTGRWKADDSLTTLREMRTSWSTGGWVSGVVDLSAVCTSKEDLDQEGAQM